MPRTLRQHRFVRGCAEIMADVVLYLAVTLVLILLLGQLAKVAL